MNMAKQFIGEVHQMVKRWEQQISKNASEERSNTAVESTQAKSAEPRAANSSAKPGPSPSRST